MIFFAFFPRNAVLQRHVLLIVFENKHNYENRASSLSLNKDRKPIALSENLREHY
jgi:hypothetical protein